MAEPTWQHGVRHKSLPGGTSRTMAMRSLGCVTYAARMADGRIKIGWTSRFDRRLDWLKHYAKQDLSLLAFHPGPIEYEQAIHARLEPYRSNTADHPDAWEWYSPTPEVLGVVNEMRQELGLPDLAA